MTERVSRRKETEAKVKITADRAALGLLFVVGVILWLDWAVHVVIFLAS